MAYRIKILKPNRWRAHPVGRIDISVGQSYHEGEKFAATLEWAQRHFDHVIVSVADTLQRHNLVAEGMGEDEAWQQSHASGDEWIARNRHLLKGCTIIRWESRLTHPLYPQFMQRTLGLLQSDKTLQETLNRAACDYAERRGSSRPGSRMAYLVEELAIFDMLFRLEPAADIYPGSLLGVWDHPAYKDHAAFTRIDFTRRAA